MLRQENQNYLGKDVIKSIKRYFGLLYKYLRPHMLLVILLFIVLASSVAVQLINPQIVRYIIDSAVSKQPLTNISQAALLFIGLTFYNQLIIVFATYIGQNVGWKAVNALKLDLIAHCLGLDLSYHKEHHESEMIERIDGDVAELLNFFSNLIINIFNNLIFLIGILVLLFRENIKIGLAISIFALTALYIFFRMQYIAVPYWQALREKSAKFYGFIGEILSGREDIRSSGADHYVLHKFYNHIKEWLPLTYKAKMINYKMWAIEIGIFAIGNIIAFGFGGYLWGKGIISIGTVYLVVNYTNLLKSPISKLRVLSKDLQKANASIARIGQVFSIKSNLENEGKKSLPCGPLEVEVKNLKFSYDENNVVLEGITIKLEKGRKLGILGRTGSGKTTVARLLTRLYDPQSGEIFINGISIKEVPLHQLRGHIAYVTQEVQIFNASLRDNLTFFDKNIPDEIIKEAIKEIGLEEWFNSHAEGLDTIIEAGGIGLSAGEMQLLVFIRIFLKNPGIVILDEIASRLDPETEKLLNEVLKKLLKNRTAIIIAHKLTSIQRVDDIVILENGKMKEYGALKQLKSDSNSHFYKLLEIGLEEVLT